MVSRLVAAAVVALVLAHAQPAAAQATAAPAAIPSAPADATAAPVAVQSCVATEIDALQNPKLGYRSSYVDRVVIAFRNLRPMPATTVRFNLRYGSVNKIVVETGSFQPQATVTRSTNSLDSVWTGPGITCTPTSVTFADGSTWAAPGR